MKSSILNKSRGSNTNRVIRPVATTSRCQEKRALTARGLSNQSGQIVSPDLSKVRSSRDETSKVSNAGAGGDKCSTGKARSPMQCAEMVFGKLSNISATGSPISHEIKSGRRPHRN